MVPSKCSENHFIFEKYKTLQPFKLHFLRNSPLVQLYTYASNCKGIGNIPGGHFVKAFSALHHILKDVSSFTCAIPPMLLSEDGNGYSATVRSGE